MPAATKHKSAERAEAERLGKLICEARKLKCWTQKMLCEATAEQGGYIYRQQLSDFEVGKRLPDLLQIKALAKALGADYKTWI